MLVGIGKATAVLKMPPHQCASFGELKHKITEPGELLVVIYFYATYDGVYQKYTTFIEEMSNNYTNVVFLQMDVEDDNDTADKFGVIGTPTVICMRNNVQIAKLEGAHTNKVRKMVEECKDIQ